MASQLSGSKDDQELLKSDQNLSERDRDSSESDLESSDSEDGHTKLRRHILDGILNVHSTGSFATLGCFESFILPGISVEEVGAIQLPLSLNNAQSLIRASRQAPFGKGNQTLVDETVRKTWEIDGSRVSFSNKAWHRWVEGVVKTVAEDLGVAGGPNSVRAELYKMLLYEEGAMFKPHKDTEKTLGMFGTLVICLPSHHTGGAVRITHGQEEKLFDTAKSSAFSVTYIAWYADVTHEIEPVQSGYRWVLTYNLINTSSDSPQSAARLDAQVARFCRTLVNWQGLDQKPYCLCYALDHQYTDVGLKLAALKGDDFQRTRHIADACKKAGDFCALLASLQNIVTFANDEGGEDNTQSELRLNHIVDLEGFELGTSLRIPESFLLEQEIYDSRDPDTQNGGEYMGNQHADIDQLYNDTVVLIIPKALVTGFLLGRGHTLVHFKSLLQRLHKGFLERNNDQHIRELIVQTCQDHLKQAYTNAEIKDLFLGQIAITATSIAEQDLFRRAVSSVTNNFDKRDFFVLGQLICFPAPVIPEDDLVEAIRRITKLHQVHRCLQAFRSGFSSKNVNRSDEQQVQYLANWTRERMLEALKSMQEVHPQDAAALIEIAKEYGDNLFQEFVKPFVARFMGDSNFSNALTVEILSFSQSTNCDKDLVVRLIPLVLDASASQFELRKYSSASKNGPNSRDDYPYSSWPNYSEGEERAQRDASVVVDLYKHLFQSDRAKASELLGQIELQTKNLPDIELTRLVLPLLEQMLYITELYPLEACPFFEPMMATYITRDVQKEPEKPSDWSRPDEIDKCYVSKCPSCPLLREFLLDPREESRRFPIDKEDPWHLSHMVPNYCNKSKDQSGGLHVLIVTKTTKGWETKHSKWQERGLRAQEAFRRLPQKELKHCLADKYDEIMDLRMVKLQKENSAIQTADTLEANIKNHSDGQSLSTIPRKRSWSD